MKAKLFIKSIVIFIVTILSFSAFSQTRERTLRLASSWSDNFPPFSTAVENFAKYVNTLSDGELTIQIDTSNKHKSPLGVFDLVKTGQYDLGHSASYYYKGIDPALLFFTTMPFGMTAAEQYGWFYYGGGLELMNEAFSKHGLMAFPGGNTGQQMGGWFRKEINSVADLDGLKMRIPGFAGEIMASLGVAVVNIPSGELYTSLERGTIDALEWVGPGMDISMGFHQIAPYYYTGWHEPGTELIFIINERSFNRLPENLQETVRLAARLASYEMYIQNYHMSSEAWTEIQESNDIQVKSFPESVITALKAANDELIQEEAKKSPLIKRIIDSQDAYLKQSREWTLISDYLYLKDNN